MVKVVGADHSKTRRRYLWRNFKHFCHWCGVRLTWSGDNALTCDHKVPLSKGGTNKRTNLLPACKTCNQTRGNTDYEVYRREASRCAANVAR